MWFVTLTTIGFGDYVPTEAYQSIPRLSENNLGNQGEFFKPKEAFLRIAFSLFTLFGLCMVSGVFNAIMAAIEESQCRPRCPGCIPRKTQNHPDNERNNTPEERDTVPEQCDTDLKQLGMKNVGYQKENIPTISLEEIK